MSNPNGSDPFGFAKFIPGFEFLQSLSQGAAGAAGAGAEAPLAGMAQWVAPTVNAEEIDKRIKELRAVQFWLEQNGRALTATIQALEVQKMTLAALQSMQGGINDWAKASPFKMPEAGAAASPAPAPAPAPASPPPAAAPATATDAAAAAQAPAAAAVDPLQWWGALTQQFQQIATQALQEPAGQKVMEAGTQMAGEFARSAMQSAADLAKAVPAAAVMPSAAKPAARASAPATRKAAPRKPAAAPTPQAAAKKTTAARKTPRRAP